MRFLSLLILVFICVNAQAQIERDSTLSRCPVYITDTVSSNNFFVEERPAILKVYRINGQLTVAVDQRGQLVSFYFHKRKLKTGKYKITPGSRGNWDVEALYSFKSGDQANAVALSSGTIVVTYDKETKYWLIKINGMITNYVERYVSYYIVKADLYIK